MASNFRDPSDRGYYQRILSKIPGFKGYLDRAERRDNEAQTRLWIANHLETSKQAIDQLARRLLDQGNIDVLPQCERLRTRLTTLIHTVRAAPLGNEGLFWQVDELRQDLLDDLYEHDLWTMDESERLATEMQQLVSSPQNIEQLLSDLHQRVAAMEQKFADRKRLLSGMEM